MDWGKQRLTPNCVTVGGKKTERLQKKLCVANQQNVH